MIEEFNGAIESYDRKWRRLIDGRKDKTFFEGLKPVALGWKVADEADYKQLYDQLHDQADKIIETWMNGRWIAKFHLRDEKLEGGITIVKLMQRRPGSEDALGLDHVDFYSSAVDGADKILRKEPDLKWSWENNDIIDGYDWISLWFDDTEAKLKAGTVLDIIGRELAELNQQLKS